MLSCGDIIAATLALVCVGTLFINPFARSLNTFFVVSNYGSGAAFFVTHFVLKASFLYSNSSSIRQWQNLVFSGFISKWCIGK